jgi:mannan endo-1,4-beta-mannosidase
MKRILLILLAFLALWACSKPEQVSEPVKEQEENPALPEDSGTGDSGTEDPGDENPPEPQVDEYDAELTNPNATIEAKKVYEFLLSTAGQKMLSGVQSGDNANNNDRSDEIFKMTSKHPALMGYDFIFLYYSPTPESWLWQVNYGDISAAKEQWANNGLVSYMWHWNVPPSEAAWQDGRQNYHFDGYAFYSKQTSFSIANALTEGTWENQCILEDIDKVAGYLKLLQEENIPVIWRPLHEAAGNYDVYGPGGAWFWWGRGGADACKKLWKLLRDKLEGEHGLNNLIWVWTLDATVGAENQYADWYPGNDLVDIVGVDIYADDTESKERQYKAAAALSAGHKMVTVSECGNIPEPFKCIANSEKWCWFMTWDLKSYPLNTKEYWKQLMGSSRVLTREAMPSLK